MATQITPHDSDLYCEWDRIFYEQLKYDESILQSQKALQLNKKDIRIYCNIGISMHHLRQDEKMESIFLEGLKLLGNDPEYKDSLINDINYSIDHSNRNKDKVITKTEEEHLKVKNESSMNSKVE